MIGHRLNGSSMVTCVAPGNRPPGFWDNSMPVCQGRETLRKTLKQFLYRFSIVHGINCLLNMYVCIYLLFIYFSQLSDVPPYLVHQME